MSVVANKGLTYCGLAALAVVTTVCGGCSLGSNNDDLQQYVAEVKSRPQGTIEPLPPLRTYDAYVYNVTAMRSPFDPPVQVTVNPIQAPMNVEPDWKREKEYLESFGVESLSMVGTLEQKGQFWALVKDGLGGINRVTVGNYLGKDHGKIVAASATQLDLVEIVSNGLGGWLERPRTLKLSEKE